MGLQAQEIQSLRLQVAELQSYRQRYEEQSAVKLVKQETQIENLHEELEKMAGAHQVAIKKITSEKEVLISKNGELKKEVAASKHELELLKSEAEREHTSMQMLVAELETERRHIARIKACSGDLGKLEEDLAF